MTFHEASANRKKSFIAFECPYCDAMFSSYIESVFDFSWSFRKKLVEIFTTFECPDCDTMFSSLIDFVLDFSRSFSKVEEIFYNIWVPGLWCYVFFLNWNCFWLFMKLQQTGRNLLWHLSARTVMQCFLLKLKLFLTFHEASAKGKKSFMAFEGDTMFSSYIDFVFDFSWSFRKKLVEVFYGIWMPRLWYNVFFSHWFCSWLFMKLQQNGRNLL